MFGLIRKNWRRSYWLSITVGKNTIATHSAFVQMLESIPDIKLITSAGALMYPLPFFLAKPMSSYF